MVFTTTHLSMNEGLGQVEPPPTVSSVWQTSGARAVATAAGPAPLGPGPAAASTAASTAARSTASRMQGSSRVQWQHSVPNPSQPWPRGRLPALTPTRGTIPASPAPCLCTYGSAVPRPPRRFSNAAISTHTKPYTAGTHVWPEARPPAGARAPSRPRRSSAPGPVAAPPPPTCAPVCTMTGSGAWRRLGGDGRNQGGP